VRWGYIDQTGSIVILPKFAAAAGFSEGIAFMDLDADSKAVIDRKGAVVFRADYKSARPILIVVWV
jgi:WG containing repeat